MNLKSTGGEGGVTPTREQCVALIERMERFGICLLDDDGNKVRTAILAHLRSCAQDAPGVTVPDVDQLAQIIRTVDGNHSLGAGALAEAIVAKLSRVPPAPAGDEKWNPPLDESCNPTTPREIAEMILGDFDDDQETLTISRHWMKRLVIALRSPPDAGVSEAELEALEVATYAVECTVNGGSYKPAYPTDMAQRAQLLRRLAHRLRGAGGK